MCKHANVQTADMQMNKQLISKCANCPAASSLCAANWHISIFAHYSIIMFASLLLLRKIR